jgi:hypothetical protein
MLPSIFTENGQSVGVTSPRISLWGSRTSSTGDVSAMSSDFTDVESALPVGASSRKTNKLKR